VPRPAVTGDEDDPVVIFYTSGTTGRPKGAVSTHRTLIANLQTYQYNAAATRAAAASPPAARPTLLLTSPMFHVSGCHSGVVVALASGARIVMPVGRFDPWEALRLIEEEGVTAWPAVPTVLWRILEQVPPGTYDTSSLRSVAYGGSPSASALRERLLAYFPSLRGAVRNAYGLTESSSVAAMIEGADFARRPASVGRPTPVTEVRVVDEHGDAVPAGITGEIWLRGSTIMPGYWEDPEATAAALTPDRWLRTGDLGRLDEDGYLYVVDRLKDVVIRGGENVYCVEIENRLVEHEGIADAAVIGVPHPTLGEEVLAVVRAVPGSDLDTRAVREWVQETLADFKVPQYVELTNEPLPRNAAGKLVKAELRERYGPAT
jgi:long-chain acyl-CoA synthetase